MRPQAERHRPSRPILPMALIASLVSASALPGPAQSPAKPDCEVRTGRQAGLFLIQAIARSTSPVSGRYRLSILRQSDTGTGRSLQSGSFSLTPGQDGVLATTALEPSAQGHTRAQLSPEGEQGRTSCTAP